MTRTAMRRTRSASVSNFLPCLDSFIPCLELYNGTCMHFMFGSKGPIPLAALVECRPRRMMIADSNTLFVVLTPLPNRAISAVEESDSLGSLGLAPSATLVLVPVPRFADAYAHVGGNPAWRALMSAVGLLAGFWSVVVGFLVGGGGGGRGGGRRGRQAGGGDGHGENIEMDDLPPSAAGRGSGSGSRIRGFENEEDRKRDAQLYNGNSVS